MREHCCPLLAIWVQATHEEVAHEPLRIILAIMLIFVGVRLLI